MFFILQKLPERIIVYFRIKTSPELGQFFKFTEQRVIIPVDHTLVVYIRLGGSGDGLDVGHAGHRQQDASTRVKGDLQRLRQDVLLVPVVDDWSI